MFVYFGTWAVYLDKGNKGSARVCRIPISAWQPDSWHSPLRRNPNCTGRRPVVDGVFFVPVLTNLSDYEEQSQDPCRLQMSS